MMTVERYLRILRRWLGTGPRAARILEEVESHLEDAAESLRARGSSRENAARTAVERFGAPTRVALDFFRRTPLVLLERTEPFALFATTLVTLTFAGAATWFTARAMLFEGVNALSFVHLGMSSSHATIVLLIWATLGLRRDFLLRLVRGVGPWVMGLGVLGLILATFWGARTGDWEYYLYVMNGNNAAMGALMLRCAAYLRGPGPGIPSG